jgi:hypothetical protein
MLGKLFCLRRPFVALTGVWVFTIALAAWPTESDATSLLKQTFNDPTVTTGDQFGVSVAIDGNNVLIGANGDDTNGNFVGQAHLFDATTGNLLQTFDDPTVTTNDSFGASVAIDGNNVLIGAGGDNTNGTDCTAQGF